MAVCEARSYSELMAALRQRAAELGLATGGEKLAKVAGLADGHIGKLLSPAPNKGLGPVTLGPLLTVLGLKLVIAEDPETATVMQRSLANHGLVAGDLRRRDGKHARDSMLAAQRRKRRRHLLIFAASKTWRRGGSSAWGKAMQARYMLKTSPAKRSANARKAARSRWRSLTELIADGLAAKAERERLAALAAAAKAALQQPSAPVDGRRQRVAPKRERAAATRQPRRQLRGS